MGVSVLVSPWHPHAVVMAPALTETGQAPSYSSLTKSPLNLLDGCDLTARVNSKPKRNSQDLRVKLSDIEFNGTPPKRGRPLRPLEVVSSGVESSMNFGSLMGDQSDNMGMLKSNPAGTLADGQENLNFMKGNDVEQLLAVIPPPNVDELMQAISTMESEAADNADSGELELTGADIAGLLMTDVDMMSGFAEDLPDSTPSVTNSQVSEKLLAGVKRQADLEKSAKRLQRRLKKLQSRVVGRHVSEEVTSVLEKSARAVRQGADVDSPCTVADVNKLLDKVHSSSFAQCQSGMRFRPPIRYFGSGSLECPQSLDQQPNGAVLPRLRVAEKEELHSISQQLRTDLSVLQSQLDSEATESSSGGDSCDESISYNNQLHTYLSIRKRAYWRWQQDRGAIANRWTWLTNQIVNLEFKIRALTEQHRAFRCRRGPVILGTSTPVSVNGYHGALPGGATPKDPAKDPTAVSARTRPYLRTNYRKLVRTRNLHVEEESPRATRASSVRCWCQQPATQCLVCTGRADPTQPLGWPEPAGTSLPERIASLDPSYHPVLSFPHDVPLELHLDSVMKLHDWQSRSNRSNYKYKKSPKEKVAKIHKPASALLSAKLLKRKLTVNRKRRRDLKSSDDHGHPTIPPITIKKARNQSSVSGGDSCDDGELYVATSTVEPLSPETTVSAAGSTTEREDVRKSRHRDHDSFDINNIVIPYSMAASARVEMLPYKEIPTPKWRFVKESTEAEDEVENPSEEDVTDEAVLERHARSEEAERRKFLLYMKQPLGVRGRGARRADSRAESSGANTPDPMSPMNLEHGDSLVTTPPATPLADDAGAVLARRRTTSSCKTLLPRDRSLTPDPPDEILSYEPRIYPLTDEEVAEMEASRVVTRKEGGERHDYMSRAPESPSSSSTISAVEGVDEDPDGDEDPDLEDPNDPEWRVPDSPTS